jgi:hypothetical protein
MEEWNDGTLEYWVFQKTNSLSSFHYSTIPLFQFYRLRGLKNGVIGTNICGKI